MCRSNAAEALAQKKGATVREYGVLEELKETLGLEKLPEYIESYDISNLAGTENVAGMIVYKNGKPLKSAYKKFKIKGFEGQDDYASMAEVISRRFDEYYKAEDKNEGFGKLPDLILLDGGKGQVAAVKQVFERMSISVPLFGMVKDDKHRTRAVTGDGGEIAISSKRALFTFLSKMQDEVHRFAIGYHHARRSKNTFKSSLTNIDGVGEVRAKSLLKYFRTIDNISKACRVRSDYQTQPIISTLSLKTNFSVGDGIPDVPFTKIAMQFLCGHGTPCPYVNRCREVVSCVRHRKMFDSRDTEV